ncbi:MAG TPA: hypothetical protein VK816_06235 [Jatrophihabitantaceae bacterium]|jgi:hypothetical protein|nr:hypothetical protein [Jatrophihabitantaceae bacterium]
MTVLIASDLDRTLIYSAAALTPVRTEPVRSEPVPELVAVEHTEAGAVSFVTAAAAGMLAELGEAHLVVPVTTRTVEQFRRVVLPGRQPRYAVVANGGVLLVDGVPDPDWAERVRARLAAVAPIEVADALLRASCAPEWTSRITTAQGLFCYAVLDRALIPPGAVEQLADRAAQVGWRMSLQGRKLYLVPEPLTKSAAVAEVAAREGSTLILAAGDSLLDMDLLEHADRAVRPAHGELAEIDWRAPHLRVVDAVGVLAGQHIVSWFAEQARTSEMHPDPDGAARRR